MALGHGGFTGIEIAGLMGNSPIESAVAVQVVNGYQASTLCFDGFCDELTT